MSQTMRTQQLPQDAETFCEFCPPGLPIAGTSEGIREALATLRRVAHSRCNPLLILGETGTGKELAARAVHAWRCGENQPFVAVNCAALTAGLLESELFGHVKGAFTGADRAKTGLFEAAGEGTIFLDEVSEMPLELQAKLLRVLQEKQFRKVGGTEDIACRATIVASSNRDLPAEIEAERFRRDLYYRLAIFPVTLPPLAGESRRADIPVLARWFVREANLACEDAPTDLSCEAIEKLQGHTWPGNVRELRNVIQRATILATGDLIAPEDILVDKNPASSQNSDSQACGREIRLSPSDLSLETAEREFIVRALEETGGQRTRAAALLGITRATLHAKLKRYGITPPDRCSGKSSADDGPVRSACA